MKVFAFAASYSKASLNKRLLEVALGMVREAGHEVDFAEFREFDMPLVDGDLAIGRIVPEGATALGERIQAADAWILACPEYNWSMPGTIKNAIDWLSRIDPIPIERKSVLLLSAAQSLVGGYRGLMNLRTPLEGLGCWCYPKHFSLAQARDAYDDDGALKDKALEGMLRSMVEDYLSAAAALNGR